MKGLFIFLGLILFVITIVTLVIMKSNGNEKEDLYYDQGNLENETISDVNITENNENMVEIDLDMNNIQAECESPIVKCSTGGCVTQC